MPRSRRILVVDDNKDEAQALRSVLELAGHAVWSAYDGITALDLARRLHPEAIVLDIKMPGLSGYEIARRIRLMPELASGHFSRRGDRSRDAG
jgi:CheY-like chemotaxis protein